jgi:hypothetical protein
MCRRKCNYNDNNRAAHAHSQKRKSVGRLLLLVCGKEDKLFFGSERTKLLSSKIPLAHFSQKKRYHWHMGIASQFKRNLQPRQGTHKTTRYSRKETTYSESQIGRGMEE